MDNSVELNLSVRKLLLQLKCNRHEKRHTFEGTHGECHGGVDTRRFSPPEKSTAKVFSVWERRLRKRLRNAYAVFRRLGILRKGATNSAYCQSLGEVED